jgi:hypothetical protein
LFCSKWSFYVFSICGRLFSKYVEKDAIHTTIKYINKTKCESIPLPPLEQSKSLPSWRINGVCDGLEQSKKVQGYNEMLCNRFYCRGEEEIIKLIKMDNTFLEN